ncbi:MAG: hypothetical protein JW936_05195 [Sedimentisphaerales bacterium]|nr:hypothetical protein [Sedimentisphaerales bacterium]
MGSRSVTTNHVCGAALGFLAFSVSLIVGTMVDNPFITVVLRALGALVVFYILGLVLVAIGHKAVGENFQSEMEAAREAAELAAAAREAAEAELEEIKKEAEIPEVGINGTVTADQQVAEENQNAATVR